MRPLILPLLSVLVLEGFGLVVAGHYLGVLPAIWYALIMFFVGLSFARKHGALLGQTWQKGLASGQPPQAKVLESMVLVGAGICFAFPGLFSDLVGLALIVPPVRRFVGQRAVNMMGKYAANMMANGTMPNLAGFGGPIGQPGASPFGAGANFPGGSPMELLLGRGLNGSKTGSTSKVVDTQATVTDLRGERKS
jgi:UPF0716 protein FxsA